MTNYTTAAGVQQFTGTILSGQTSVTININTVGAGALVCYGGSNPSVAADFAEAGAYLSSITSTTLVFTRQTGTTGTVVVTGSITDGDTTNLIKAVQQGTVSIPASTSSGTASVTAPGSDGNSVIHFLGQTGTGTALFALGDYASLTQSGNTVTATSGSSGTSNALTVGFGLYEFQAGCMTVNAVQRISAASSSNVTSWTASLGANVVMNNAISFWGGTHMATITTNDTESMLYGALTAVGTFTVTVNTGVADLRTYNACILEHNSGVLNSAVQRGTTTLTGVTSNTTTLTAVNELYAGVSWLGNSTTAGVSQLGESTGAAVLTTNTLKPSILHENSPGATASGAAMTINSSTAGSTLIYPTILQDSSTTITGITDSKGQTWLQVTGAYSNDTTNGYAADIWYFPNTVSGVTSITVTTSDASSLDNNIIYEVSNIVTTSPIDAHASLSTQPSNTSFTTGNITTTAANDFIVVVCEVNGNDLLSVNSPYTIDTHIGISGWYLPSTTVTNNQATFSGATGAWCASSAAFLSSNTTVDVIKVTKATSTANIIGSWEVFEFPAYSGGGSITYGVAAAGGTQATSGTIGWAG